MLRLLIITIVMSLMACGIIPSSKAPLSSATMISTQLPTSVLVTPTNTYTPVPANLTTPLPTLSPEEKEKIITQLFTEDYHCILPCWGGIEPSVTQWSDAKVFLEQFAETYSNKSAKMNYMGKPVYTAFYVSRNTVEAIGVSRFEYPVHRLLQDYGKPDEVYFYVLDALPIDADNPYTIYLFYKDRGIVAEYNGASPKGATISVCFKDSQEQKSRTAFLSLWAKDSGKTFQDVVAQYMSQFSPGYLSMQFYKLEELSAHTTNNFFEIYELDDNENYCLQINNPNPKP